MSKHIKFGLYQQNCVRVESGLKDVYKGQTFILLKDDKLSIFCPYLLQRDKFPSETYFFEK